MVPGGQLSSGALLKRANDVLEPCANHRRQIQSVTDRKGLGAQREGALDAGFAGRPMLIRCTFRHANSPEQRVRERLCCRCLSRAKTAGRRGLRRCCNRPGKVRIKCVSGFVGEFDEDGSSVRRVGVTTDQLLFLEKTEPSKSGGWRDT